MKNENNTISFKIHTAQFLLSYRFEGENLELITIGSHENYYRDLKKYLKSNYREKRGRHRELLKKHAKKTRL